MNDRYQVRMEWGRDISTIGAFGTIAEARACMKGIRWYAGICEPPEEARFYIMDIVEKKEVVV